MSSTSTSVSVQPVGGALGAEIHGVDLDTERVRRLRVPATGEPHRRGRRRGEGRPTPRQAREHGPSEGPHLHFGLLDQPDLFAGKSMPFVIDRFTLVGAVDFETSEADHLVITPDSKQVRRAYPLYGGIQNFPGGT